MYTHIFKEKLLTVFYESQIDPKKWLAVVGQGHKGVNETRRLLVRSPLEGMNYYFLIFLFLRFGTKAKVWR